MTKDEVVALIQGTFDKDDWREIIGFDGLNKKNKAKADEIDFELISADGDYSKGVDEGSGYGWITIFRLKEQYWRLNGYYSSWEGHEWGRKNEEIYDFVEVKPVQKMVTFYEEGSAVN